MIEPTTPPVPPTGAEQQAAQSSSGADQALEVVVNLAVEGGVEAFTQSDELVGTAVVASAEAVGSLLGSIFDAF